MDFAYPADDWVKIKENKKRNKYLDLAWELKKVIEHEIDGDTDYNWYDQNGDWKLGKKIGRVGNQRMNQDHPNYWGDLLSHDSRERPSVYTGVKNFHEY